MDKIKGLGHFGLTNNNAIQTAQRSERMMNTHETTNNTEENLDRALRPTTFDDFLGQEDSKANLEVYVKAALSRGEALDHILLAGPPGLGKTTLAGILANEMGAKLVVVNAPSIKTKGELASVLASLRKGDILFLDEIHSLNNQVEEVLYPAMEDFKLEVCLLYTSPSPRD